MIPCAASLAPHEISSGTFELQHFSLSVYNTAKAKQETCEAAASREAAHRLINTCRRSRTRAKQDPVQQIPPFNYKCHRAGIKSCAGEPRIRLSLSLSVSLALSLCSLCSIDMST